ncbi:MAG: tRNA (guanosine(46)-N7)-methyltransferase TrmB [Mycoplasmataceae bacterium]|nr:tRNA (guanosine(46)-N7)-methyltransferase TrmB [Mycoplasmataceae bacterium]MBR2849100.1 tRNA (guanosine(46)-N7)-methyltransferase TrmB [Mycoplasmataceae bacterium]MBR2999132.1 tRNA (guanosine(46)-N7)-methyltransferase TrmB [Mycoplasmataceae bacterium]MBR3259650.1 tRNA (guanosine(46)-N7)-methyltransferase TrmB [Mycoplasmataceae bacterium]
MRLRNDPKAREKIDNSNLVIKDFPIKLNENVILEIGMGKGEMLIQLALNNPNNIYIGIEKYPTVVAKAISLANKLNLKNFFVVCNELSNLENNFDGKVKEIWLTFSDPWPKKSHYKRRLTYFKFLNIYKSLLTKEGILKLKTDNDDFFNWSIESFKNYGAKIIYLTNDLHNSEKNEFNIQTGYEIKWSKKGKNINYIEVSF